MKLFPIINGLRELRDLRGSYWATWPTRNRAIPWAMLEPHEEQALSNHGQSLEELAKRGGMSPSEMLAVLDNHQWKKMPELTALLELEERVISHLRETKTLASCPFCGGEPELFQRVTEYPDKTFVVNAVGVQCKFCQVKMLPELTQEQLDLKEWTTETRTQEVVGRWNSRSKL